MLKSKCRMVIGPAGQLAECRAKIVVLTGISLYFFDEVATERAGLV